MSFSKHYDEGLPYYKRIPYSKKIAKDAEWVEHSCEYIDRYFGQMVDVDRFHNTRLNYNLAKGRGEEAMKQYANGDLTLLDEGINPAADKLKHFDILSSIFKSMVGEEQKRKLKAIAYDISGYNINLKKKKTLELYQDYIREKILSRLNNEATQEIFLKHGIENPLNLAPEQQQDVQLEIEELVRFKTPKDIEKYMTKDYRSPSENMIQKLLDWYIAEYDLKIIKDEAFKHLILAGKAAAMQDVRNKKPYIELLNPEGLTYLLEKNKMFIDEAEWWKYEKYVSYTTAISELDLRPKDFEKLKEMVLTASGYQDDVRRGQIRGELPHDVERKVATINMATEGAFLDNAPNNLRSPEGQAFIGALYNILGDSRVAERAVRLVDICYTSFAKVQYVRRKDNNGNLIGFWVGENYKKNPELDYDIHTKWAKEYWRARKLGHASGMYFQKERVKFQNRSLTDPFKITPPFVGVEYSRLFDNSPHVAPIDFGKPYQYEYNIVKNKIEELDRTNIGKVFVVPESYIPHDWSYGKFSKMLKLSKIAPINENADTLNPGVAGQILKSVDLSNNNDIAAYMQRLQMIRREAEMAMSYSPSQQGLAPASMTATNNQQNIIQGSYKTEDIFNLHQIFINRVLVNGVNTIKLAMTENKEIRDHLLSSMGIAMSEYEQANIEQSDVMIDIINDTERVREMDSYKGLLQPMVQNGLVTSAEAAKIQFEKNPVEIINLAEESERKAQERRKEQQEREERMHQRQIELDKYKYDQELQMRKYEFDEEQKTRRYVAEVDGRKFLLQNDVDMNAQNDMIQKALIDNDVKREKIAADKEIDEKKLRLEEKKIEVEKEKVAKMNARPSASS
jgi:hypothetical protein